MIVAERSLFIKGNRGPSIVLIRFQLPVYDRNAWICGYSIGWPEGELRHRGMGVDAVQALYGAMQLAAVDIYASRHHRAGTLYFDKPGDGYGLPLPFGSRDQALGDDKRM